jgi:hypothetical protein
MDRRDKCMKTEGLTMTVGNTSIKKILVGIICLITLSFLTLSFFDHPSGRASSQSDYPVLPEADVVGMRPPINSIDELVAKADIIAKVSVSKALPREERIVNLDPNSNDAAMMDKAGLNKLVVVCYSYVIRIEDVLKGSTELKNNEITLELVDWMYQSCPRISEGDTYVLLLNKRTNYDTYRPFREHESFFYYASDDKVYPSEVKSYLDGTSGMVYEDFKAMIQKSTLAKSN